MRREETLFEVFVSKRLAAIRQEKLEAIGAGVDEEQYRLCVGYIRCLKDVADIMAEARKKIDADR